MVVLCAAKAPIMTKRDRVRAMCVARGIIVQGWDLLARTNAPYVLLVATALIKRQYFLCCVRATIIVAWALLIQRRAHCYMNLIQEWRVASQVLAFILLSLGALA